MEEVLHQDCPTVGNSYEMFMLAGGSWPVETPFDKVFHLLASPVITLLRQTQSYCPFAHNIDLVAPKGTRTSSKISRVQLASKNSPCRSRPPYSWTYPLGSMISTVHEVSNEPERTCWELIHEYTHLLKLHSIWRIVVSSLAPLLDASANPA